MGAVEAGIRPAQRAVVIVAPDEDVVREIEACRSGKLGFDADPDALEPAVLDGEPFGARDIPTPAQNATSVLRNVMPSKMWYAEPITSNNLNAPSPSKTTSPSPADLITIGLSAVPFAVSK
jgi:hypothetical protein